MRSATLWITPAVLVTILGVPTPGRTAAETAYGPASFVRTAGSPDVFTERFAVCRPDREFQLRIENGPDGAVRIASGTVTLNGTEIVHPADLGPHVELIERSVRLEPANTLTVQLAGTPRGTARVRVVSPSTCGPEIAIMSPAPGATVLAGSVVVQGTVGASGDVGVSVNGFPALVSRGEWAVEVRVDPADHLLSATATPVAGEPTTTTVPITVTGTPAAPLRLEARRGDGIVPLVVSWHVSNGTGRALLTYELDPTGSGVFEPPAASLDTVQTTYSTPGLWVATLRATDDHGVTHTARTVVLASEPAAVTARFDALWTGFKSRLQAGDVPGALHFLSPLLRPRMELVFQQLDADLPAVAAALGGLHVTDQAGDLAEAVLVQDEPSGPALYFIQFRRDSLGRWLIEEM